MNLYTISLTDIYHFLLVAFRTGALFMTVPVFGHMSIPRVLRIWLVLLFAFVIIPWITTPVIAPPATLVQFVLVILNEIAIGLLMGFGVIIFFSAVQFAGHLIGLQMGLAVANVVDPMGAGEIAVIGEFYYFFSLIIFVLIDGHYIIINALIRSFELLPPGGAVMNPSIGNYLITLSGMVFVVAVKLAAPVIITLFILNAILGIIARTVPQMNVFIVGFPLAIGVGLALIAFTLPVFALIIERVFGGLQTHFFTIIRMLQG
ncbi:flagellar biosynthetic protein FliR [bacterium]|nr:flagellar biosynthetic protein FliR [bacterium]